MFDSSWSGGAPVALVTTELIDGYKPALEGQTVRSQVLVVVPPAAAYGESEINEDDLVGETLVFVIDILAAVPTPSLNESSPHGLPLQRYAATCSSRRRPSIVR